MNPDWVNATLGGLMIGASAALLLLGNGRIAGISGLLGNALNLTRSPAQTERYMFLIGLLAAPLLYWPFAPLPALGMTTSIPLILVAGLLVGFGVRMGSGCTSGHGVCGTARLSRRSIAAMITFMATGIGTVALMNLF
ncbi:YeeE/YedE family protein [Abyssibius alkaniclasticus]|uniref:YeeE/YedE family protein n=1 Tax=Abyssibius alkaniclasticus TaxID=2881234 RepID=UPI0023638612|nr:YeeE/YedE family protein [Abyssibius alkaniclasticus]UPH69776.1 YeeE/YedE family protein [Abyssibius alkaniclasticus]|tara:strand:+ start:165 stop:578 length:414 start_codon:yes stop_codon:yes gene_type:complete